MTPKCLSGNLLPEVISARHGCLRSYFLNQLFEMLVFCEFRCLNTPFSEKYVKFSMMIEKGLGKVDGVISAQSQLPSLLIKNSLSLIKLPCLLNSSTFRQEILAKSLEW